MARKFSVDGGHDDGERNLRQAFVEGNVEFAEQFGIASQHFLTIHATF